MTDGDFPDALPSGAKLHWYVIERVLGQGGFGITYLAHDSNLDRRVAIKEYLPSEIARRRADASAKPHTESQSERFAWGLERFLAEARTLARFDHPNIVRVLSVFEANGTAYMVMRFEEGEDLAALLERRGTLPERQLTECLLPVLEGLELVHAAGFIHRDVKPENIYVRKDGSPVLLDFGSARQSFGSAKTMTILVAPGYAPLEQYYGDAATQGPWTDIYGLGATCYRAIAGCAPLDAVARAKGVLGSAREVLQPALEAGRGRYSEILLAAVDHSLRLSEKDRPQTIGEWRRELTGTASAQVGADAATPATAAEAASSAASTARSRVPTPLPPSPSGAARVSPAPEPRGDNIEQPNIARENPAPVSPVVAPAGRGSMLAVGGLVAAALLVVIVLLARRPVAPEATVAAPASAAASTLAASPITPTPDATAMRTITSPAAATIAATASGPNGSQTPATMPATTTTAAPLRPAAEPAPTTLARNPPGPTRREAPAPAALSSPGVAGREREPAAAPRTASREPATMPSNADPRAAGASVAADVGAASSASTAPTRAATTLIREPAAARTARDDQLDAAEAALRRGDSPAASRLLQPLAAAGVGRAQALLGRAQEARAGGQQSDFEAFVWYGIAARNGQAGAQAQHDRLAGKLQPAEVRQAEQIIEHWKPRAEPSSATDRSPP